MLDELQPRNNVYINDKFLNGFLFEDARYKVAYGGRGSGKSWGFAQGAVIRAYNEREIILCCREYQRSIRDSVHRLLTRQIYEMGLPSYFQVTEHTIRCRRTGSEFLFAGLHHNSDEIKSLEGVTICWVEEAHSVSEDSWTFLDPTIREAGSQVWVSFNPMLVTDPTYQHFVLKPPPNTLQLFINWRDNPDFPPELEAQRQHWLRTDPDAYQWIWEGHCRKLGEALVFRGRYTVEGFETPEDVDRFYYGADWGFANDPSVLIRCFVRDDVLYVDHEAYAVGVEIDDLTALFAGGISRKTGETYEGVPGARNWPILADCSRPETISYVANRGGLNISGADKWQGSVEDGLAHLKSYRHIVVHERCRNTAAEFSLYSYKTDPKMLDENGHPTVLPKLIDKHNHCIDALRYALNGEIVSGGGLGVWRRLAGME